MGFTIKRKHDNIKMLRTKIKKGEQKMRNKIKNIHNKLSQYKAYQNICLFVRTLWRVGQVLVPGGIGGYLLYRYNDQVILVVGAALVLYSFLRLVNSAYLAEASINKRK